MLKVILVVLSLLVSTSAVGDNKPSLRELDALNSRINEQIKYMPDEFQYGIPEYWVNPIIRGDLGVDPFALDRSLESNPSVKWILGGLNGDCEDYVLAKRSVLIEQGYGDYVSIATAWVRGEGYHAVLVVQAKEGEYVLDNLHRLAHKKQDLRYNWHLIQKGKRWFKIQ